MTSYSINDLNWDQLQICREALSANGVTPDPPVVPPVVPPSADVLDVTILRASEKYPRIRFGIELRKDGTWWAKAIENPGKPNQIDHGYSNGKTSVIIAWNECVSMFDSEFLITLDHTPLFDRIKISSGPKPKVAVGLQPGYKSPKPVWDFVYSDDKIKLPNTNALSEMVVAFEER